jgi:hypothetical protein
MRKMWILSVSTPFINHRPVDAVLKFQNDKVIEFFNSRDGVELDVDAYSDMKKNHGISSKERYSL